MRKKRGFTLIEIMVVVLIIMILSGLAIVSVNQARKQARDAKRISDMNTIASALQAYYADHHSYVLTQVPPESCDLGAWYPRSKIRYAQMIGILKNEGYLQSCPYDEIDPPGAACDASADWETADWGYRFTCSSTKGDSQPCDSYMLATVLETSSSATACLPAGVCGNYCGYEPEGPEYRIKNGEPLMAGGSGVCDQPCQ